MKLREILESFNTKPEVQWRRDGDETWGFFKLDAEPYAVCIKELDMSRFKLTKSLKELGSSGVVTVIFGNITEKGTFSTMARGKETNGIRVISAVLHTLDEYVTKSSTGVVIFAAKKRDGFYESRASLYGTLCTTFAKRMGFSFKSFKDADGTYYITIRDDLPLTKDDIAFIENEIVGTLSFPEKLKQSKPTK